MHKSPVYSFPFLIQPAHSLLAHQMLVRVRDELNIELPLNVLFSIDITIYDLAKALEEHLISTSDEQEVVALMMEIGELTDDEIAALMKDN
jgi:hypothetical protein